MTRTALQQCSSPLLLLPAYGKTYPSAAAMLMGWQAGHDFKMYGSSTCCSIRDWEVLLYGSSSVTLCQPSNPKLSVTL